MAGFNETAVIWLLALCAVLNTLASKADNLTILVTAGTQGEFQARQGCATQPQLGGLAQRSTLVKRLREEDPTLLLIDTGNAFFNADSLPSKGKAVAAAYDVLGYDAINLTYRDFRLGMAATLGLLEEAKFPIISANLLSGKTGDPLAKPYTVNTIGNRRVALIGVTQSPAGLIFLPHLKKQLAGIRIAPPVEALERWVPKAKMESDSIVLLYYGSIVGLEAIKERFGQDFAAIFAGGSRLEYLPKEAAPLVVGTSSQGQHLTKVSAPFRNCSQTDGLNL